MRFQTAQSVFVVVEGKCLARSEPGSVPDFEFIMEAPAVLGESALSSDDAQRVRAASVFAAGSGCTLISFNVCDLEVLVGYTPQRKSMLEFNRKLLASVKIGTVPLLEGLDQQQTRWVVDALGEEVRVHALYATRAYACSCVWGHMWEFVRERACTCM